jgi:hypothetical protein
VVCWNLRWSCHIRCFSFKWRQFVVIVKVTEKYLLIYRHITWLSFPDIKPLRSYVGPRPTLWFSCSRRFSWSLTLSNPIFLPPAYSPAFIYFGWEGCWWITCNYPTVLKQRIINRNRKSTTYAICWLKSVIHEETTTKSDIMIFLFPMLFLM